MTFHPTAATIGRGVQSFRGSGEYLFAIARNRLENAIEGARIARHPAAATIGGGLHTLACYSQDFIARHRKIDKDAIERTCIA